MKKEEIVAQVKAKVAAAKETTLTIDEKALKLVDALEHLKAAFHERGLKAWYDYADKALLEFKK